MNYKVVITKPLPQAAMDRLYEDKLVGEVEVWESVNRAAMPHKELVGALETAAGLLCLPENRITADMITKAPNLRVVSTMSSGYNHIDLEACAKRGIPVGHTPNVVNHAAATHTLRLILNVLGRNYQAAKDAREGRWMAWGEPDGLLGRDLSGLTCGIIGLGGIGQEVARLLSVFDDLTCLYTSRTRKPAAEQRLGVRHTNLDDLLARSDIVTMHVPLTDTTHGMCDANFFAQMKPGAVFINTARGGLVDQEALVAALLEGRLGGAGLDVTDPEPLPTDHPLWTIPNCTITPHIATATEQAASSMALLAVRNLLAGLHGDELPAAVQWDSRA